MTEALTTLSALEADLHVHGAWPPDGLATARAGVERAQGRYAIVRDTRRIPSVDGLPGVCVWTASGPRRHPRGSGPWVPVKGVGVAVEPGEARLRALAEALERYSMLVAGDAELSVRAPYDELAPDAVPVDRFALHSAEQYRRLPALRLPARDDPIDWAWGYSLTRDRPVMVPSSLAFPAHGHAPPNNFSRGLTSTGVATHVDVEAAILAGLFEVVERDALMLWWVHDRPPPRLTVDGSTVGRLLEGPFAVSDFSFRFLDLTLDSGVPTVACIATSDNSARPSAVFGSAARLDPDAAAVKALLETAQVLYGLHHLRWTAERVLAPSEVRTIEDHARFYGGAGGAARLARWTTGPEGRGLGNVPDRSTGGVPGDLAACVSRLAAVDLEVVVVDLTTPDVASCGFHTVNVLVPGAVDINGDPRLARFGGGRIHSVAAAAGWPPRRDDELNTAPCPLA